MSDIPYVAALAGFAEFTELALETGASFVPVVFTNQAPFMVYLGQNKATGYIDARKHIRATILIEAIGQNVDYQILGKRTTIDNDPQTIVSGTVVAGSTVEVYADTIEHFSHIKVEVKYTTSAGTCNVSALLK